MGYYKSSMYIVMMFGMLYSVNNSFSGLDSVFPCLHYLLFHLQTPLITPSSSKWVSSQPIVLESMMLKTTNKPHSSKQTEGNCFFLGSPFSHVNAMMT